MLLIFFSLLLIKVIKNFKTNHTYKYNFYYQIPQQIACVKLYLKLTTYSSMLVGKVFLTSSHEKKLEFITFINMLNQALIPSENLSLSLLSVYEKKNVQGS